MAARALLLASTAALATVVAGPAGASGVAEATSRPSSASGSRYCQLVRGNHKTDTAALGALMTPGQAAAAIKAAYKRLKADESRILAVVPSPLKRSYETLFSAVATIFGDLAKVGFDVSKLPASVEKAFVAESSAMASASRKIAAYDKQVCHVDFGATTGRAPTPSIPSGSTTYNGISVGTKLPAGFPKSVPLPANGTLVGQVSTGSKYFDLWLAVTGSQQDVVGAYKSAVEKAGGSITSSGNAPGGAAVFMAQSSSWTVTADVFPSGTVAGISKSDVKAGQVEVALVVAVA